MSEWFNLLAWKAGVRQRTEGSNRFRITNNYFKINNLHFY